MTTWQGALERARRCLTARGRRHQRLYLVEGERLVRRAIAAGAPVREVILGEDVTGEFIEEAELGFPVVRAPSSALLQVSEGRNSGRWLALVALPSAASVAAPPAVSGFGSGTVLVLADIQEPGNVGALARTALASRVSHVIGTGVTDGYHPKAVRTSMGALFKLGWHQGSSPFELAAWLRERGIPQVGTVLEGGLPLPEAPLGADALAFWIGNEAQGLPAPLLDRLDRQVTIPMPPGVDSFSVNAAAAIVLYERGRQRDRFSQARSSS